MAFLTPPVFEPKTRFLLWAFFAVCFAVALPADALEVAWVVRPALADRFEVVDLDGERPLAPLAERVPPDMPVPI